MILLQGPAMERKLRLGQCIVRGCTHEPREGRRMCHKCRHQRRRELNPAAYCFQTLKGNARRRNHVFTITLDYFTKWCARTGYLETKGRGAGFMTIDRDDPRKGYEPGNLKILEHVANVRKRWIDDKIYGRGCNIPEPPMPYDPEFDRPRRTGPPCETPAPF